MDGKNKSIPTGFIPKSITSYITKNYKDSYITKIEKEGSGYEVNLNNGIELEFDSYGKFRGIDD